MHYETSLKLTRELNLLNVGGVISLTFKFGYLCNQGNKLASCSNQRQNMLDKVLPMHDHLLVCFQSCLQRLLNIAKSLEKIEQLLKSTDAAEQGNR